MSATRVRVCLTPDWTNPYPETYSEDASGYGYEGARRGAYPAYPNPLRGVRRVRLSTLSDEAEI